MKIVNCTKERCTHYCGRSTSVSKALGSPIDMSKHLGNPFPMRENSEKERARVVQEHKVDLWRRIRSRDSDAYFAVKNLPDDAVLGCFCAPRACHCENLILAHEWANTKVVEL